MSWMLLAQTAEHALPPEVQSWTQTGVYGALTILLGYLITKGIPKMIEDFRAESKEARTWHSTEMAATRQHYHESQKAFQEALDDTVTKFTIHNDKVTDKVDKITDKLRDSWKPQQ